MKYSIVLMLIFFQSVGFSQQWGDSSVLQQDLFYAVEENPKFGNGVNDIYQYLASNLIVPKNKYVRLSNITITVKLVVAKTGKVVFAQIVKGIDKDFDAAVLNTISKMPAWNPATQNGYSVPCTITLPIFVL